MGGHQSSKLSFAFSSILTGLRVPPLVNYLIGTYSQRCVAHLDLAQARHCSSKSWSQAKNVKSLLWKINGSSRWPTGALLRKLWPLKVTAETNSAEWNQNKLPTRNYWLERCFWNKCSYSAKVIYLTQKLVNLFRRPTTWYLNNYTQICEWKSGPAL